MPIFVVLSIIPALEALAQAQRTSGQADSARTSAAPRKKSGAKAGDDTPISAIVPFDTDQAATHQETWAKHLGVPVEYTNSLGMKFRLIPPGEFRMGGTKADVDASVPLLGMNDRAHWIDCLQGELPQHTVILTKPCYLATCEVTQQVFQNLMDGNPSFFSRSGKLKEHAEKVAGADTSAHPVEGVTWNEAAEFCVRLSQKEKLKPVYVRTGKGLKIGDGTGYRLPTEAEWEFACRAGTATRYWSGDSSKDVSEVEWTEENSQRMTHPVGELKANPFGLYDMHGNVWEWVQDAFAKSYYAKSPDKPVINPTGPVLNDPARVLRGGHALANSFWARSSVKFSHAIDDRSGRYPQFGFRVALSVEAVRKKRK